MRFDMVHRYLYQTLRKCYYMENKRQIGNQDTTSNDNYPTHVSHQQQQRQKVFFSINVNFRHVYS